MTQIYSLVIQNLPIIWKKKEVEEEDVDIGFVPNRQLECLFLDSHFFRKEKYGCI
jgi:hypothetical protein